MSNLKLFGSITSPYVRRVRIVAAELGLDAPLVDTATDAGQTELRLVSPVWKVPVAQIEGQLIYDSAQINRILIERWGSGVLVSYSQLSTDDINLIMVIDGALDSLINAFYLSKDGVTDENSAYVKKQKDRAAASLTWLEQRADGPWLGSEKKFGLPEIALISALDWMRLREAFPVDTLTRLSQCAAAHASRPSVAGSGPLAG
jgi:glutathione S-transferase